MFWDVAMCQKMSEMCQNSWFSSYWLNDDLVIDEWIDEYVMMNE